MSGYVSGRTSLTTVQSGNIAADAITSAKIADDAIDSEHYTDASVDLAHMSSQAVDEDNLHISNSGSNGQFLSKQSGDAGGLTWAAAGGLHTFLSTNSPSGAATTAFTTTADFSYDHVDFVFINMQGSLTGAALRMETSTDGGSSYRSSAYRYGVGRIRDHATGAAETSVGSQAAALIVLTNTELDVDPTTEPGFEGTIRIFDPSSSNEHQGYMHALMTQPGDGTLTYYWGGFVIDAAENIDSVRFSWSTGTMTGDIHMVGVNYA